MSSKKRKASPRPSEESPKTPLSSRQTRRSAAAASNLSKDIDLTGDSPTAGQPSASGGPETPSKKPRKSGVTSASKKKKEEHPAPPDTQVRLGHELWMKLLGPDHINMLSDAVADEVSFRVLARHFWRRAFIFQRRWSVEDQDYIYKQVLKDVSTRDRNRLKGELEDAFRSTEEAFASTVKRFAQQWLSKTEKGLEYGREYERFRIKKQPKIAPKPTPPRLPEDLLTVSDGPKGFYWTVAVATRFWGPSIATIRTANPQEEGVLKWFDRDVLEGGLDQRFGLWYGAMSSIALELIRRAVLLLVQGDDKMNEDAYRADFGAVLFAEEFCTKVLNSPVAQLAVDSKLRSNLLLITSNPKISRQGTPTSVPYLEVSTTADDSKFALEQGKELPLLDPNDQNIEDVYSAVRSNPDSTGRDIAASIADELNEDFHASVVEIPNTLLFAVGVLPVDGILDPPIETNYAGRRLGEQYAVANIFGRCTIHRTVMEIEIARIESVCSKLMERKDQLLEEIAAHEKSRADALARTEIARRMFKENELLVAKSLSSLQELSKLNKPRRAVPGRFGETTRRRTAPSADSPSLADSPPPSESVAPHPPPQTASLRSSDSPLDSPKGVARPQSPHLPTNTPPSTRHSSQPHVGPAYLPALPPAAPVRTLTIDLDPVEPSVHSLDPFAYRSSRSGAFGSNFFALNSGRKFDMERPKSSRLGSFGRVSPSHLDTGFYSGISSRKTNSSSRFELEMEDESQGTKMAKSGDLGSESDQIKPVKPGEAEGGADGSPKEL